ncbi:hypothetical protein FisN_27Lh122 [Fistulifera solaris]|uniref:UBA domain-containing protein n=1 Tax=Fistulifera solaris TaxID=1519565 RepID=A0A1Z5KAR7_FISSO|nr:hypothetical protein FisN_27Lh122 [Fistulifera solaris]|eukprot:GAX23344.1 hypothetical protein FisN_27Lh122 [Fistulifera solaris]
MIQVKLGNQEAKSMLPSEAAEYLQSVASLGANAGRDLRVQFGNLIHDSNKSSLPKKPPGLPCTEKEMKALMSMFVEIMGLQMNTERLNETKPPPVMKNKNRSNLFQFPTDIPPPPGGWPDDLTWPNTETLPPLSTIVDEDNSLVGLPALEDIPEEDKQAPPTQYVATLQEDDEKVTGSQGIAPFEWDALERVAVEEALEHEERTRKNFRRNKKERAVAVPSNETAKKVEELNQAALQKAEQLFLARKKAIVSWRTTVIATFHQVCQNSSTSLSLLEDILEHSPLLQDYEKANPLEPHLEELLPLFVKHRHKGQAGRLCLARFILRLRPLLLLAPIPTIGRSVLHIASWWGESELVDRICHVKKELIEYVQKAGTKKSGLAASDNFWPPDMKVTVTLNDTCQESGWNAVHYSAISGNLVALEILLRAGCKVDMRTNSSHTWSKLTGNGVTARELVRDALSKANDVETLGTAWLEISKEHQNNPKLYTALLNKAMTRLDDVARGLFDKTTVAKVGREVETIKRECEKDESIVKKDDVSTNNSTTNDTSSKSSISGAKFDETNEMGAAPTKRIRKKKKKLQDEPQVDKDSKPSAILSTTSPVVPREDPVVTALLGMGFQQEDVKAAINACGGHSRATVDNAVAWIFGQQESTEDNLQVSRRETETQMKAEESWSSKQPKKKDSKQTDSLRSNEKPTFQRDEQLSRNRIASLPRAPESKPPKSTRPTVPVASEKEKHLELRKSAPLLQRVGEEEAPNMQAANSGTPQGSATAASSIEHRTIEIFNDDATVSTLGSIATRSTIVPHNNAPPGFHVPPTMHEEPGSSNWNHNAFGASFGSHPGPPAISESMAMQGLGIPKSPATIGHRTVQMNPIGHQSSLDSHQHHHLFGRYNPHNGAGTNNMNQHVPRYGAAHRVDPTPHFPTFHEANQHHQYGASLSAQYQFLESSSNFRSDNERLGSSLFASSNASDPLLGSSGFGTSEPHDFPIPIGLGLETLNRENEITSLWDNQPLSLTADHGDNGLGVHLFGFSDDDEKQTPKWGSDGLGGSIW